MELTVLSETEKLLFRTEILELMEESDSDFVPPLSQRSGTTQSTFSLKSGALGTEAYYEEMSKQKILAFIEDSSLLGFVSYRENYVSDEISERELPNIYISTLILSKRARGRGLTRKAYEYLFTELYPDCSVFTRTWSTNAAHTKILSGFGFFEIKRKKDDRGKGIDTVYYKKEKIRFLSGLSTLV